MIPGMLIVSIVKLADRNLISEVMYELLIFWYSLFRSPYDGSGVSLLNGIEAASVNTSNMNILESMKHVVIKSYLKHQRLH